MEQLTQALTWLHSQFVIGLLIFIPLSLVVTTVFKKRAPAEEAELRAKHPRLVAVRELFRGLGWDAPKIRMALAMLLMGKPIDPFAALDAEKTPVPVGDDVHPDERKF